MEKLVKQDRSIIAVYLRGSLLYGSPLLGGAGDVDLVLIHDLPPEEEREIIPLTPEIHFDIHHHDQERYQQARSLRVDPWLGPSLFDAEPIYDPRHFLDYTQAGVRSNFSLPETTLARARPLLEQARSFWMERQVHPVQGSIPEISLFLKTIHRAVNAVALLSGPPLPTRRLGIQFPDRARAAEAEDLIGSLNTLLGGTNLTRSTLESWLAPWSETLDRYYQADSLGENFHHKKVYYQRAVVALLETQQPTDALWPLISTWTEAVDFLAGEIQLHRDWKQASTVLGFAGKDYLDRLSVFDRFLDRIDSVFDSASTGTQLA